MPERKHFITFCSPGTFTSETTTKPISSWDTKEAIKIAQTITERHGAKPYGFLFETKVVADPIPDGEGGTLEVEPKSVKSSGIYYLGGKLETYDDIEARKDPKEETLLWNMKWNDYPIIIVNTNSWKFTAAYKESDSIVDAETGEIIDRGDDKEHKAYRQNKIAELKTAKEN